MSPAPHHRLAVELTVWIAERVRQLGKFSDSPTGPILDSANSPFAGALYTMLSLDCAATTDANGNPPNYDGYGQPPPHFRLMAEPDIRARLQSREIAPRQFSNTVRDFVRLHDHVPHAFQLTGGWFRPLLPHPLLNAFIVAGFLECQNDQCRWLEPMAETIEWTAPSHAWESKTEAEERRLRKYGPVWKTMPSWIRDKVVTDGKLDTLMLPDSIRRFWNDGRWQSQQLSDWQDQKRLATAMQIADEIQRLIEVGRLSV